MTEQAPREKTPSEILSSIKSQIDFKRKEEDEKIERRRLKELKGTQLFSSIIELAKIFGHSQGIMVGAGSSLERATQIVVPAVEVGENEETVRLQIIQEQPHHVNENRYGPKAFNIFINGSILSHVETGGRVTNWYGEEATTEQIDLLKDKIVPAIGLKLAMDHPELNITREQVSIREVIEETNSSRESKILFPPEEKGPITGGRIPSEKTKKAYRVMGPSDPWK